MESFSGKTFGSSKAVVESKFDLPHPNEAFNYEDTQIYLSNLQISPGFYCGYDTITGQDEKSYYVPRAFDVDLLELTICADSDIISLLAEMSEQGWPFPLRKKLRGMLSMKFVGKYIKAWQDKEHQLAVVFWESNDGYQGGFRGSSQEDFQEWLTSGKRMNQLTDRQISRATVIFTQQLNNIADWCMNDYSYRRGTRGWIRELGELTMPTTGLLELPVSYMTIEQRKLRKAEKIAEKKQAEEAKKAAELAKLTPEQKISKEASERAKRLLASLVKKGKVEAEVIYDLSLQKEPKEKLE